MVGAYAVTMVKYLSLLFLHGSIVAVCICVYIMTPETAHSGDRIMEGGEGLTRALTAALVVFFFAILLSSGKVVGTAVKIAIESCDKVLLGVDIEIEQVALSLCRGYVKIRKLKVLQPDEE